ncbi:hypothetical protein [Ruminococcus sp. Marseille-P6503]|uniref:hypothetical protein n=1 Tax=Ruminococcus sp. Marseille-P6503 TaxID=2364796 RepID=UPI000F521468|nr:hypothetical protein [Ruminococcus sp. Marseille-P6503]
MRKLKTVELNVEKDELKVNGENLSDVSEFNLHFDDGIFRLEIAEDFYATGEKKRPKNKGASIME